jgi:hypothetical protein
LSFSKIFEVVSSNNEFLVKKALTNLVLSRTKFINQFGYVSYLSNFGNIFFLSQNPSFASSDEEYYSSFFFSILFDPNRIASPLFEIAESPEQFLLRIRDLSSANRIAEIERVLLGPDNETRRRVLSVYSRFIFILQRPDEDLERFSQRVNSEKAKTKRGQKPKAGNIPNIGKFEYVYFDPSSRKGPEVIIHRLEDIPDKTQSKYGLTGKLLYISNPKLRIFDPTSTGTNSFVPIPSNSEIGNISIRVYSDILSVLLQQLNEQTGYLSPIVGFYLFDKNSNSKEFYIKIRLEDNLDLRKQETGIACKSLTKNLNIGKAFFALGEYNFPIYDRRRQEMEEFLEQNQIDSTVTSNMSYEQLRVIYSFVLFKSSYKVANSQICRFLLEKLSKKNLLFDFSLL